MTSIAIPSYKFQSEQDRVFHTHEGATDGATGPGTPSQCWRGGGVVNPVNSTLASLYLINTSHLKKTVSDSKHYSIRVVVSGRHVEVYQYSKSKVQGIVTGKHTRSKERKGRQREDNVFRGTKHLERTINANVGRWGEVDKFITLTHKEDLEDIDKANYLFMKGIMRMKYHFGNFKYIAVPEIQKRRALSTGKEVIHDHVVTFGLPYVDQKQLTEIWGHGWVWVEKCQDYQDPGKYMAKYIGKDFSDSRYLHHKAYFGSQGLYEPVEYLGDDLKALQEDLNRDLALTFESKYENDSLGTIHYFHYLVPASSGVALSAEQARAAAS